MKQWSSLLFLFSITSSLFAETGLVRVFTQTNDIPHKVSEIPMAAGANYETDVPPTLAEYAFTHWTLNVAEAGASRDELGRAYERLPYHLADRVDLTAHYLPKNQDRDDDGVFDADEIYWYGSLEQDATSDTDGDGRTFSEELAAGTNPLMADGEEIGAILYSDGDDVVYNPHDYARFTVSSETEGLVTTVEETSRPGMVFSTPTLSPNSSTFAYWTRNGEPCRDELGRALNGLTISIGSTIENFVAVSVENEEDRYKLYWYGTTDIAMDSDTDGDGRTFSEELAAGTNPLMADGEEMGSILYSDGEMIVYNPFDYKSVTIVAETAGVVLTNSCEWLRPGTAVTTSSKSPNSSTFAYWTRNGEPCRDELGRALDHVSFTMGTAPETLFAVQVADDDMRQKLYWYGTTDIAMDSDTDGDGRTFSEELAAGTNPLMADGEEIGAILVSDGRLLLYDPFGQLNICLATSSGYVGVYDGVAHGISVEVQRPTTGATIRYSLSDTGPYSLTNPTFTDIGEWTVWYQITADDYEELIECETVKITKAPIGGDEGEEPGSGTIPEGGLSKYDTAFVYDGMGHTIETNALATAFSEATGGIVDVVYAVDDGTGESGGPGQPALPWKPIAPTITNTGSAVVWYKVTSANYADYVHAATVSVTPKPITITAQAKSQVYGEAEVPLTYTAAGLVGDDALTGALTRDPGVGAGIYAIRQGTLSNANYAITYVGANYTILKRMVTLVSESAEKVYDRTPLVKNEVKVKDGSVGFVDGEDFTAVCSGSQTAVGSSNNTFTYMLSEGTEAANYEIVKEYGTLTVTKATFNPSDLFLGLETATEEDGILCERVYNGLPQPFEVDVAESFTEPYVFSYALTPGAYTETAPTLTNVADGALKVYFMFVTPNYEPYEGFGTLRILPKEITEEMVQPGEDAFFWDGPEKMPTVMLYDYVTIDGIEVNVATESDFTHVYGEKVDAGVWATVTAQGNYTGTVSKIVPILKRPVTPPVITPKSYNGRNQTPTIPTDERWAVVSNPGGVHAGSYTNVILRLTNTSDFKWKGQGEEETDWTGVFAITRANNGWTGYPNMTGWVYGETPSEPQMGRVRYGTVKVAYRRKGTDVSTETSVRPELPGIYIARFWADATQDYIGVSVNSPYREVEFEITGTIPGGTETLTTPVPVPYTWLDSYVEQFGGDYERAANAKGLNGVTLWESYVAGLVPTDPTSRFTATIEIDANGRTVVTWTPDLREANPPRTYIEYGKEKLTDAEWTPVTAENRDAMRFFKVGVKIK